MVTLSPSAEIDISSIASTIATHRPKSAIKWLDDIEVTFEMLDNHPDVGQERHEFSIKGCRSFSFGSHVIFFRRTEGGIEIARVIHASRDLTDI